MKTWHKIVLNNIAWIIIIHLSVSFILLEPFNIFEFVINTNNGDRIMVLFIFMVIQITSIHLVLMDD